MKVNKKQDVLDTALEVLEKELREEPLSPERIVALTEAIKVLSGVNPLSQF